MHLVERSKLSELVGTVRSAITGGGIPPGVSRKYQIFRFYFWDNTCMKIKYQVHEDVANRLFFHMIGYLLAKSPYIANYMSLNIITQTYGTEGVYYIAVARHPRTLPLRSHQAKRCVLTAGVGYSVECTGGVAHLDKASRLPYGSTPNLPCGQVHQSVARIQAECCKTPRRDIISVSIAHTEIY